MIKINNITKKYITNKTEVIAVDNVSLEIKDGEIFGIIGFSGAGKSTLLRCMNLLEEPDKGEIYIDGEDITKAGKKQLLKARRNIGMIFQQFNLLDQRNVLDNICYPLEIAQIKRKEAVERAINLLKLVELENKEKAFPSELSGGQKQRVAIARSLATQPSVLLCDEATSALDPMTTKNILELLKNINKKLGVTIVIITHEMSVIEQICDRVAIMSGGKIEEIGTVGDIFISPKSEIGKRLVLPDCQIKLKEPSRDYLRVVFDGQSSFEPVFAGLITEIKMKLNILGANTKDIGGKAYGQMLIERPESPEGVEKIRSYLADNGIFMEEISV